MENFILTTEWMSEKFNEMNARLFDYELGSCSFEIFTKGRGMYGNTLGWFCCGGKNIRVVNSSRKIYTVVNHSIVYIDKGNFVSLYKPIIKLNGNYTWSEKAALSTLVHEMCHYYVDMHGCHPKRCHGNEFKHIAKIVSDKAPELFTVQRLASAEQMSEMDLKSEIKEKKENRLINKISNSVPTFIFYNTGKVKYINCNKMSLVNDIIRREKHNNSISKIVISEDISLKSTLRNLGFRQTMTKYGRYWDVSNQKWVNDINKFEVKVVG